MVVNFALMSLSYTSQKNEVVEGKNMIVVDMASSMLQTKGLINTYWADAIQKIIYILN